MRPKLIARVRKLTPAERAAALEAVGEMARAARTPLEDERRGGIFIPFLTRWQS